MDRKKKIAIVSHCVLNQNSVVYPLARAAGALSSVLQVLIQQEFGIYQLPCPELHYGGLGRKPMSYQDYDTPEYRFVCARLTEGVLHDLLLFAADGCEIRVLIGIGQSPTCASTDKVGHFMETLLPRLLERFPALNIVDIPVDYRDDSSHLLSTILQTAEGNCIVRTEMKKTN